jgi:hypothetical protein
LSFTHFCLLFLYSFFDRSLSPFIYLSPIAFPGLPAE